MLAIGKAVRTVVLFYLLDVTPSPEPIGPPGGDAVRLVFPAAVPYFVGRAVLDAAAEAVCRYCAPLLLPWELYRACRDL